MTSQPRPPPVDQDAHQLRQKILYYSFYQPHVQDRAFSVKLVHLNGACIHKIGELYQCKMHHQAPNTYAWASTLTTTHPLIEKDVHFFLRKALDTFGQDLLATLEQGLKEEEGKYSHWWNMTHGVDDFILNCL